MNEIPKTWEEHPLWKEGVVEMLPTAWVYQYRGLDVSPETDLGDGVRVDMEVLWDDMCFHGMRDPLIFRVGLHDKNFRLEAGNHRIQVLHKHGVVEVPVTVQIRETCGPQRDDAMTDATHNFHAPRGFRVSEKTETYMKPSDVFYEGERIALA